MVNIFAEGPVSDVNNIPNIHGPTRPDCTSSPANEVSPERDLRKRRRAPSTSASDDVGDSSTSEGSPSIWDDNCRPSSRKRVKKVVEVPIIAICPPPLAFPKSIYHGQEPASPPVSEALVLKAISAEEEKEQDDALDSGGDSYINADLEDFVIYRPHRTHTGNREKRVEEYPLANELVSLHEINEWNVRGLLFDGVIWFGGEKYYVQKVPFENLSIGGYGVMDKPAATSDIWIQSFQAKRLDVWYRLRAPASEYERYHKPFLWMAELAKHTVDFLSTHTNAVLDHFSQTFNDWLMMIYGSDGLVSAWKKSYRSRDFRHVVSSQANFLFNQARQVDQDLEKHKIWSEIHPRFLNAIPEEEEKETRADMFIVSKEGEKTVNKRKTTVTPYVYECFKHLPWEKFLYRQVPNFTNLNDSLHSKSPRTRFTTKCTAPSSSFAERTIDVGDVVALPLDKMTTWKSNDSDWYGYVQRVTETPKGPKLDLLWLYRPSDTQCLKVPYYHSKELFLSDHCNCGDAPIYAQEVLYRPKLAFFGSPSTEETDFFVRQRYVEGDGAWQTLQEAHFRCDCQSEKDVGDTCYPVGLTLLVEINKVLEPVVLEENEPYGVHGEATIRRLLRKNRDYGDIKAAQNELVYTYHLQSISCKRISRVCQVRSYTTEERDSGRIPSPYSRQGTGDFFFVTSQDLLEGHPLEPLDRSLPSLFSEGWDPRSVSPKPPLRGLDIFCGGGNFARGLEEGGAVKFEYAVDWYREAIHTYKANLKDEQEVHMFYGSVNDYLTQAMQGKGRNVAQQGDIEVIAAGSPCQGFSAANPNKGNDRALFNVSMVASVVAYVDFYRPKYALMENVKGMAVGGEENMLALLISSFVGMGYQVRTFSLDAWSFGSPQSRTRIFISIAAPGMIPMPEPPHTHSHPEDVQSASLGKTANGLRVNSRFTVRTPFRFTTCSEAVKDLPETDARVTCIPFPDHRMSRTLSTLARVRIGSIPRFPGGNTFITAYNAGYMPQPQIAAFAWSNKIRTRKDATGWQRVERNALMPTILTEPRPDDGAGGKCLAWDQERLLTVMEVRRGQGFPDDEVLIGLPSAQWKIIGNSVARTVALALGVSLREAWLANVSTSSEINTSAERVTAKAVVIIRHGTEQLGRAMVDKADPNNQLTDENMFDELAFTPTPPQALSPASIPAKRPPLAEDLDSDFTGSPNYLTKHVRESKMTSEYPLSPTRSVERSRITTGGSASRIHHENSPPQSKTSRTILIETTSSPQLANNGRENWDPQLSKWPRSQSPICTLTSQWDDEL